MDDGMITTDRVKARAKEAAQILAGNQVTIIVHRAKLPKNPPPLLSPLIQILGATRRRDGARCRRRSSKAMVPKPSSGSRDQNQGMNGTTGHVTDDDAVSDGSVARHIYIYIYI